VIERTRFQPPEPPAGVVGGIEALCRQVRGDVIRMTTLAGSGHPGGSMSSTEIFALLWSQAAVDPENPWMKGRDRILVSHGHTSPAVYSVLGRLGFFDAGEAVRTFRLAGSPFEGHIERTVPGVELTTGNLGQGLSGACGFAIADRLAGFSNRIFVVMGDGEQQKGQIVEARRFAKAFGLSSITVVVDMNGLQISGRTADVMPVDLEAEYSSDGWEVIRVDGHDIPALYRALRPSGNPAGPRVVLAETVMGRGVSFMENDPQFHGRALTRAEAGRALAELGIPDDLDELAEARRAGRPAGRTFHSPCSGGAVLDNVGNPRTYPPDHKGDNRSAFGLALTDLASVNSDRVPLVFDCDLAASVKTEAFAKAYPSHFIQSGIMEHHTASAAGAASLADRVVFWADFGVFAADETFNQHRLNDINMTNLKVVATHCGLDVGPDGKTHHCIKYLALMGSLRNCSVIVPADPNQTDRAVRFAAANPGNYFIAMGRSKTPVITGPDGTPLFGEGYRFVYGAHDLLKPGKDAVLVTMGSMCHRALEAAAILERRGIALEVISASCPVSLSPALLDRIRGFPLAVSYEDHDRETGLGSRIAVALSAERGAPPLLRLGVDGYGLSGDPEALYEMQGLLPEQVADTIEKRLGRLTSS